MPAISVTSVSASNARRLLAYGFLGLPLAFAALPIYVHVPRYYADSAGVPLALLGALLLGARLFDAAIDPWLGWLADRLPRRSMVAVALVPFLVGFVALLNPPETWVALWLVASLALTYAGFSAASVAYQAWGADAGGDSRERTRLTASREGFGLVGVVLAAALPGLLAADLSEGVSRLSWVLPPVLLLAAIVLFAGVESARARSAVAVPLLPSLRMYSAMRRFAACWRCSSPTAWLRPCQRRCSCSSWPTSCRPSRGAGRCSRCTSLPVRRRCPAGCVSPQKSAA